MMQRLASKMPYLFAENKYNQRTSSTRNPDVSRVLACDMGVDHLMSGHQLCDKESLVGVFLGGLEGIHTVAT